MGILQPRGVQAGGLARIRRVPHTLNLWRVQRIEIEHENDKTIIQHIITCIDQCKSIQQDILPYLNNNRQVCLTCQGPASVNDISQL